MGHELWKLHCSLHLSKWWSSSRALSFCMIQLANPPIKWNRSENGRNEWLTTGSCCSTWKGSKPAACNISSLLTGRREMTQSSFVSISIWYIVCMYGHHSAILVVTNVLLRCAQSSSFGYLPPRSFLHRMCWEENIFTTSRHGLGDWPITEKLSCITRTYKNLPWW